jgi:hypothetical protein
MMRIPTSAICFVALTVVLLAPSTSIAADKTDFSGSYTLTGSKGGFKFPKGTSWTLRVIQTESELEITKTIDGKQDANTFQLDGSEGVYTSSGGQKGTGKAQIKGKTLVLDILLTTHPQPKAPSVQIHRRERLNLSSD